MNATSPHRHPRAFELDDPTLKAVNEATPPADQSSYGGSHRPESGDPVIEQSQNLSNRLLRTNHWATLLATSLIGLATLSISIWFTNFIWATIQRNDAIGWGGTGLLLTATLAALAIFIREILALVRVRSLRRIRALAEEAREQRDIKAERAATRALTRLLSSREDLAWPLARFREHAHDPRDPGDLLILADRELMLPLDQQAQNCIMSSARRVSVVTAMSPNGLLSMGFVLYENIRMLRVIATLYGGRPGLAGALRLGRMVFLHILATGGLALTDDLFGQFIGQDLLRRLSRRLGEGVFNGALTARIGIAAMIVIRPIPYVEVQPPRLRNLLSKLFKTGQTETKQ